ncbi:MAG TPA: cyanophycin synthetase, partial [Polyangiaceae bacterium]|nr:cyanophycin synthetase [Polyangiaceae bacterium]
GVALRSTDLSATTTELSTDGTHIALAPSATAEALGNALHVRLVGDVFAENAIAAALALLSVGIDADTVRQSLSSMQVVPGRFEVVHNSPLVAVDFAHTPDALARTCATARRLANGGRVIVVFGAGGARDKSKREPMGKVVGAGADVAVVTSDNPRNEDPAAIANALGAAARAAGSARVLTVLDRRRAIEVALEEARPPDVVVICGKGHEQGQLVDGTTLPFSDAEVVLETLGVMPDPTPCRTEPYPCL